MSANNRLASLREAQGLSRQQLAAQITSTHAGRREAIHERTVRRWESGSIPEKHWARLAEIFGVSVSYLLGLDSDDGNGERSTVAA